MDRRRWGRVAGGGGGGAGGEGGGGGGQAGGKGGVVFVMHNLESIFFPACSFYPASNQ